MAATPEHAARVLGLSLGASLHDVRRVRRKMALKYHPDRCHDKEQATRHMARINAAADTLTAHIRKRVRPQAKGKSPNYTDFSKPKQADQGDHRLFPGLEMEHGVSVLLLQPLAGVSRAEGGLTAHIGLSRQTSNPRALT